MNVVHFPRPVKVTEKYLDVIYALDRCRRIRLSQESPKRGWVSGQWSGPTCPNMRTAAIELRLALYFYRHERAGTRPALPRTVKRDALWAAERAA